MNSREAFETFLRIYAVAVSRGFDKPNALKGGLLYVSRARSAVERFWLWLDSDRSTPIVIANDDWVWKALYDSGIEHERLDADLVRFDPCGLDLILTGDCEHTRIPKRTRKAVKQTA